MDYFKYLRPKEYYKNLYDELTVKECRRTEQIFLDKYPHCKMVDFPTGESEQRIHTAGELTEETKEYNNWLENLSKEEQEMITLHKYICLLLLFTTGDRAAEKTTTINTWIQDDTARDKKRETLWQQHQENTNKRCRKCGDFMQCFNKMFHTINNEEDKILFIYECIDCNHREGELENGEIWKRKKPQCFECNSLLKESRKKLKNKIRHYSECTKCDFKNVWDLDLSDKPKKKTKAEVDEEKLMERDKLRFCLSEKKGQEYKNWSHQLESISEAVKKHKEAEKNGESNKQIEQLEQIPVLEAQKRIKVKIKNKKFLKLKFGEIEVGRNIVFSVKVYEADTEREPRKGEKELEGIIKKALDNTNWKLMSEGISSRMGIFSGRIRGVEKRHYY